MHSHISPLDRWASTPRLGRVWALCFAALTFASDRPVEAQTPQPHPRIWLTPDKLTQLKNYASRNTPRWQTLKYGADVALNDPNITMTTCLPLALVYQVTGDTKYAQKAISLITAYAIPSNTLSGDEYYWFREGMPTMSAAYDWCYDQMTTAQRQKVATWLMDRADDVWPDTNPSRVNGWAINSAPNNYFYGFLMTWPAALAVLGDGTDTGVGNVSGSNRPLYHTNLGMSKYRNLVRPFTDGWGKGGVFAESTNYDSVFRLGIILDAYNTALGVDLANEIGFDFIHDSVQWRIHSTLPSMNIHYLLGDQPVSSYGYMNVYDRDRMTIPAAITNDVTARAYGKSWLDRIQPSTNSDYTDVTWEFLYYNEDVQSIDYTKVLPTSYFAPGPGILVKRSSWAPDATYWGIWAGPLQQAHQNCAVGGFHIFKEGWLLGSASTYSWSGVVSDTQYHNTMTFGGNAQIWQYASLDTGRTIHREVAGDYSYFSGNATSAYNWSSTVSTDYVRKFAVLSDSIFLVYDRATLTNPASTREWYLHSQKPIAISGRDYNFDNGKHRLWGRSLLPANGVTINSDPINLGVNNTLSSYRLKVVGGGGQATDYMLNVLQVAPIAQTSVPPPSAISTTAGNMDGSVVGNWVVMFGKSDLITTPITYQVVSANQTEHLVLDQIPLVLYKVTVTDANTGTTSYINVTATDDGSLRFSVPPGSNSISLGAVPGTLVSVAMNPDTVAGGTSSTGTITVAGAAPAGGITVNLSSGNSAVASVPASVTVAAGDSTATFTAITSKVANDSAVTIKATAGGISRNATLNVLGPLAVALNGLSLNPASVVGGSASTGTVTLTAPALSGGYTITLSSSNFSVASVSASLTVPAGASSASFTVNTSPVSADTSVNITASAGTASRTAALLVSPRPLTAPSPPTNLLAAGGNGQAALTWNGSAYATSYNVKRSLTSGGPYSVIGAVSGTTYLDSGLVNGTTYFYVVTAVNGVGESDNSNEAWTIPLSAPQVLRVNCGGPAYTSAVMGLFSADGYFRGGHVGRVPNDIANTSDPELYRTYRAADNGEVISYRLPAYNGKYTLRLHFAEVYCTGPGQRVFNVDLNGTPLLSNFDPFAFCGGAMRAGIFSKDIDVTPGGVLIAFSAAPNAPIINAIELIPNNGGTAPPAPTGLTALGGDGQVTLNWNPSAGATGYNVKRSTVSGGPYTTIASGVTPTTFVDTAVTNYTTYYYVATAVNASGESPNSNEASAKPGPVPPPPTNLNAVPGDAIVYLSWSDAPRSHSYKLKRSTTKGGPYTVIASQIAGTTYANDSLTNGTTYYYVVSAVNTYGESGDSNEASATPFKQKPDAPTNLAATPGNHTVSLKWNPAARAGSYNVKRALVSGGPYTTIATGVPGTTYVNDSLTNGAPYYYVVSAVNAGGESANSNEASATPSAGGAPPAPTGLNAAAGDAQIGLNWSASAGATSYNLYRSLTSGGEGSTPYRTGITGVTAIDTGLSNGTTYYYQVTAVNTYGESPKSNEASATPRRSTDPPTNLTATAGDSVIYLGWTASSNGTSYNVKRSLTSGGPYATIASGVTGTTYINNGLVNGTTCYYVVTAVGVAGESPNSNEASATPKPGGGGPTGLTATPGDRIIYLAWNPVLKAQSYKIKRSLTPGGPYTTIASGVTGLTYANDSLTNGLTYYYVVSAVSLAVESPNSNEASATPFMLLPGAPPNVTATALGSRTILVQWGTAARARSYNLKRSTTPGGPYVTIATGIPGQTYYNDSLTVGVTYYYVVSASNGAGEGPNSNEAGATAR